MAPWVLAKSDRERLGTVMVYLLESLKIVSVLVWPFMPETSEKIQGFLGLPKKGKDLQLKDVLEWGKRKTVVTLSKIPHLFPRIEENRGEKGAKRGTERKMEDIGDRISFQEFQRLDLRVGTVLKADKIPGSKRLIKKFYHSLKSDERRKGICSIQWNSIGRPLEYSKDFFF